MVMLFHALFIEINTNIMFTHIKGHPHEGSSYPSQKVLQTAWHRLEHAKSRISELDSHRSRLGSDASRTSTTSSPAQKQGSKLKLC